MKVFKVIVRSRGVMMSCNVTRSELYPDGMIILEYKEGQKTVPVIGKLFAFETEAQAVHYAQGTLYYYVWEVWETETPSAKRVDRVCDPCSVWSTYRDFWKCVKKGWVPSSTMQAYPGTVLCPSITMIKKVTSREDLWLR